MTTPILTTKLYIPTVRRNNVTRQRLIDRLNNGLNGKLTLISAPAGFGKTTLLSTWVADCDYAVAWLSLDDRDNDAIRFLLYVIAALQMIDGNMGQTVKTALNTAQPPPIEALMTLLINDMATYPDDFMLVLDDYHIIDMPAVDNILTFLLDHQPPQMHLVIATREDPQLPLARLRARAQLTEIRAADLRFSHDEAADFLQQMTGINFAASDVAALEKRTEGWVAGLQMAAISMQGRNDTTNFIEAFTGSHRFVLDYLIEEVLQNQAPAIRHFLLQTSILTRLNDALCNAVTAQNNSRHMLDTLERGNLFVIALDDNRQWYRYHHLFADALQAHLLNDHPELVTDLHLRACDWYTDNGSILDAIQHAVAANNHERTANLLESVWAEMDETYQSDIWFSWAQTLPEALVLTHPVLCLGFGWALLNRGDLEPAETWFHAAERWLTPDEHPDADKLVVVDNERFELLEAAIAAARAYRAIALGNISATITYAQHALTQISDIEHAVHRQATALLGIAYWASGDLEAADQALTTLMLNMQQVGNLPDAMGGAFILAHIRRARGHLRETFSTFEQLLQQVADEPVKPMGTESLHRGLANLYREWNQPEKAEQHLALCKKLGKRLALPNWEHRTRIAEAHLKALRSDWDSAIDLLNEAERLYVRDPLPDIQPIAAIKARIWIWQNKLHDAQMWAQQQNLSATDDVGYLREYEHITLARLQIAQYEQGLLTAGLAPTIDLLERLLNAAQNNSRIGSAIEILILLARAFMLQNDTETALEALERALTLAEPQGYVRLFVDEGAPLTKLLQQVKQTSYVQHLLAAFGQAEATPAPKQPLIDPLSDRELDVLRLLTTDLSGPEIADELMISLNTMRTHTKNIYSKLGVGSRRVAVRRAEKLGIV